MGQMVQLFVSAPPDIKRPYYKRDVLNLCCLPIGEYISLSYGDKWLSPDTLTRRDAGTLNDLPVLLIFCEKKSQPASDIYDFHPIRFGRTGTVNKTKGVTTLPIILGSFCRYHEKGRASIQLILQAEDRYHPNYPRSDGDRAHEKAKLARIVESEIQIESAADGWEEIIDKMAKLNDLSDSLFFVCTGPDYKPSPTSILNAVATSSLHRPEIDIVKGAHRELDIYVRPGQQMEFSPPEVVIRDALASVSGPFVRQHQSGYLVQYILDFKKGWDAESSLLRVVIPTKSTSELVFRSPEFNVYVKSKSSFWVAIGVVALLAFGTLILSIGLDLLTPLSNYVASHVGAITETSWPAATILPILVMIFKFVGTFLFGVGAYIALRKLPVK